MLEFDRLVNLVSQVDDVSLLTVELVQGVT